MGRGKSAKPKESDESGTEIFGESERHPTLVGTWSRLNTLRE